MHETGKLMFLDLQNDDYELHMAVRATSGNVQGFQDIYACREDLNKWAEQLLDFTGDKNSQAVFRYGTDDVKFYAELRLTAFAYESGGHSALEIIMDNHADRPYQNKTEFCIHCMPADLNELGRMILDWYPEKNLIMEWIVKGGT